MKPNGRQRHAKFLTNGRKKVGLGRRVWRCSRASRPRRCRPPTARSTSSAPPGRAGCAPPASGSRRRSRSGRSAKVTPSTVHTKRLRRSAHSSVLTSDGHQDQRAAHGRRAGLGQMRSADRRRAPPGRSGSATGARSSPDRPAARSPAPTDHGQDGAERQVGKHVKAVNAAGELLCDPVQHSVRTRDAWHRR